MGHMRTIIAPSDREVMAFPPQSRQTVSRSSATGSPGLSSLDRHSRGSFFEETPTPTSPDTETLCFHPIPDVRKYLTTERTNTQTSKSIEELRQKALTGPLTLHATYVPGYPYLREKYTTERTIKPQVRFDNVTDVSESEYELDASLRLSLNNGAIYGERENWHQENLGGSSESKHKVQFKTGTVGQVDLWPEAEPEAALGGTKRLIERVWQEMCDKGQTFRGVPTDVAGCDVTFGTESEGK